MRPAAQAAHLLMQGLLEIASWPEFEDDEFVEEVRDRLKAVGYELGSADGYWLARAQESEVVDGLKQIFQLNQAEYAVLAALYLHLRFLARQSDQRDRSTDQASVAIEDIERGFPGYTIETVRRILSRLRNLHFVRQHDERLYAGPYLAAIDSLVADERAIEALRDFKLRSHLTRRLAAIQEQVDATD